MKRKFRLIKGKNETAMDKLSLIKRNLEKNKSAGKGEVDKKRDNSKYWVPFLIFIFVSWPPFYGYMFLKAYIEGFGFDSTHLSVDIQEAVWFFFAGISNFWANIPEFFDWLLSYSLIVGGSVFFITMIALSTTKKVRNTITKKAISLRSAIVNWLDKHTRTKNILIATISGIGTSLLVYSLFILLFGCLAMGFLFSILGDIFGSRAAERELWKQECIYAPFNSDCPKIEIDSNQKSGLVVYSNEKSTFFVTSDGRYQLNDKGRVMQFRPFTIDQINGLGNEPFDVDKWQNSVEDRGTMVNDFISNHKEELNADKVLNLLGDSDSKFHYKEFPAYKLSGRSTCAVAFPYDWDTKEVVNVVKFGKCK